MLVDSGYIDSNNELQINVEREWFDIRWTFYKAYIVSRMIVTLHLGL
mgnify:CR=1 FL=1